LLSTQPQLNHCGVNREADPESNPKELLRASGSLAKVHSSRMQIIDEIPVFGFHEKDRSVKYEIVLRTNSL
jgi:predicted component of type VI protein secretion system